MTIIIPSSSAEIMANPARFLDEIRAGHSVYLSDLGRTLALAEADEEVEDMVPLRSDKTGVDNTIFVSTKGYAQHAPRIKIAVDPPHTFNATSKSASMAIHDYSMTGEYVGPNIVEQAKQFIDRNRETLLDYWEHRIDTAEFIERMEDILRLYARKLDEKEPVVCLDERPVDLMRNDGRYLACATAMAAQQRVNEGEQRWREDGVRVDERRR